MKQVFDVIIVGAGPSGSSCAYNLIRLNPHISILLLDRASFPRYKPCGGGISPEVTRYLDFDISPVINHQCQDAVMIANGAEISVQIDPILMVRREAFDHFLLNKAQTAGVTVLTATEVLDIEHPNTQPLVKTKTASFSAKIVVLAEGSRGRLAKKLQIALNNPVFAALEYEHYTDKLDGKLYIDLDHNPSGYAWNFPKADGLSLGMGAWIKNKAKEEHSLPQKIPIFAQQFGATKLEKTHLFGHPIQGYNGRQTLVHGRIVLIGEIAGCVDPLTAEGIRPAIKSGYLAATVLAEAFRRNHMNHVQHYDALFHCAIGKDLQYARLLAYCLYHHREKFLPLISTPRALTQFMRVFSGEATYRQQLSLRRFIRLGLKFVRGSFDGTR